VAVGAIARTWPSGRRGSGPDVRERRSLRSVAKLRELVIERLGQDHSPQQISGWLRLSYPDNDQMQVSHETIYRALYVQARGSFARELTRHLRTRRQKRYARAHSNRGQGLGRIAGMVMISERPPEVCDRAVPGHWEGDLLMGTRDSAIATLVERQTRYCQLVALPEGTNAEPVCEALKASITTLPVQLRRSLTGGSAYRPASRCTSAIPEARGSAGRTRTPTASFANTSRKAKVSPG
jgi:IS30 family transposase